MRTDEQKSVEVASGLKMGPGQILSNSPFCQVNLMIVLSWGDVYLMIVLSWGEVYLMIVLSWGEVYLMIVLSWGELGRVFGECLEQK